MSLATFPAPTQTVLHPRLVVTVNGVSIPALAFDAQHGVDQPVGTATITVPLPLPDRLRGADGNVLNVPVEVQAGHDETAIRTVFSGRIDADRMEMDTTERTATLYARGWATLLDWEEEDDLEFAGPIPLHEIARSLCRWRGVPKFRIDPIVYPDTNVVLTLGGNSLVDDGKVIIPRRTSPLSWLDRKVRLFGYRLFDTPSGELRVQRISGTPQGSVAATYAEGVNAFRMEMSRDLKPMVTYWTVEGATIQDHDGVSVTVLSRPASVPYTPLLNPPGYRAGRMSDNDLITHTVANAARLVAEVDHAAPYRELSWEAVGDAWRQPGDVVRITSPTFDHDALHWLMSARQRLDARDGYVTSYSAWSGGGEALATMSDLRLVEVGAGPYHIGDETVAHYARPTPQGATVSLPFTVPSEYTSIAVSGLLHGSNSMLVDGANTELKVSKVEFWQSGESVGTADLPVDPENLLQRLDYRQIRHWQRFRLPLPSKIEPGPAEVRFIAGEDGGNGLDDYEIRDVTIELRGSGRPALPTPRGVTS